ncbi:MAG: apolipoprotein N-acyltransferase [Moraxella sp.]|nr:apolipoprotein N-acyltransferase [Moraxella sp.]
MRITTTQIQKHSKNQRKKYRTEDEILPLGASLLAALISGALFLFALAPYHIWGVALLSPLVLYALLLPAISGRRAFMLGWIYGFGLWATGAFWLYTSIHEYGAVPAWLAFIMIGMMAAVMGLFHAVMAWLFVRFLGKQPLAFASLWVLQEWLKTWLFTGFPWLFVGYAFTDVAWLSALAPVVGVLGLGFVVVLTGAALIDALRGKFGYLIISGFMLATSILLWLTNPNWTSPTGEKLSVSLVQGNIPQDLKWLTEYRLQTLDIYTSLSQNEWGRDVVIWPEAAIPILSDDAVFFVMDVAQLAKQNGSAWITGIPYRDLQNYDPSTQPYPPLYNAVLAMGDNAEGLYKKQRLVPFGEYIPFQGLLDILPNLANGDDVYNHSKGTNDQTPLRIKGKDMGSAICYEVAYPDTTRRNAKNTEFLLTISNDAWFGTSAGPLQHLQMVQMRSLETGKWFVRATNTGVTALIDDKGRIVKQAPQFERTVLRGDVPMMVGQTPYVRFGDYPLLMITALLLLLSIWGARQTSLYDSERTHGVRH